jgi:Fic family protein
MTKYIWEAKSWPDFSWDIERVMPSLTKAKISQGYILGQANLMELRELAEIITEEAFNTSSIEGANLDKDAIRSSVARRLGLPTAGLPDIKKSADGVVEILINATTDYETPLVNDRLFGWHAALFPTGHSGMFKITVGNWRKAATPMQVVSGPMGKEKVHYVAPPSKVMAKEMKKFMSWWNKSPKDLDGIIRAAIAHFWFISIHPFDDGNGRLARCLTDMALAQEEKTSKRLYSLSSQIILDKNNYYDILERTQKGSGDITEWIIWFLNTFICSIENSKELIEKSMFINIYYKHMSEVSLNERQSKVIKKLLEYLPQDFDGGLTNKKYVSITKGSPESAKRDLKDLVNKGILLISGAGRSTSYRLNRDF